MAEKRYKEKKY